MSSKVLMILHMPPPVHGASVMGGYIHDSLYINRDFECKYINETLSSDVAHVGHFGLYKIKSILSHCKIIAQSIREFHPDLVYITPSAYQPEMGMLRYVFEFAVINHYKCRKVIHFHNKGDKAKCCRWYFRWYYKMLFKRSKVIFLSPELSGQFDFILRQDQILFCPNGIKVNVNTSCINKSDNQDCVKLLFLSNLIEFKGVMVLLDALYLLKERGVNIACDFVGAESLAIDKNRFESEVKERNLKNVVYHGKRYGDEKEAFLNEADIFVHPTLDDCFPLVLLEAMAHGLPCITTRVGGIPEIIQDGVNGIICEPGNAKMLADSIEQLVANSSLRQTMGQEGYRLFNAKYTITVFEKNFSTCIHKALE